MLLYVLVLKLFSKYNLVVWQLLLHSLHKFGKQLLIKNEGEFIRPSIPAIPILIDSNLTPNMASMNSTESCFDFTIGFSTMIDTSTVPGPHYLSTFEKYGFKIPLCAKIYCCKCLVDYTKRMKDTQIYFGRKCIRS